MTARSSLADLVFVLAAFAPGIAAAQDSAAWAFPKGTPPKVAAVNEALLAGDFPAFTRDLPEAWASAAGDPLTEKNLTRLAEEAYAVNNGRLPGALRLPPGVEKVKLVQRRTLDRIEIGYVVEYVGATTGGRKIRDLKLTRYPSEVVLDWHDAQTEHAQEAGGAFYLKRRDATPMAEGLYKVSLTLDDGSGVEAWVPIVDWASDRSPDIEQPTPERVYDAGNPVLAWRPYTTGDRGYAYRGVGAEVIANDAPDYTWHKSWSLWGKAGDRLQATVGKEPAAHGVVVLGKGRYLFNLTYVEDRQFGDLTITKASAHRLAFYVH